MLPKSLGIDPGEARTGVAISDALGMLAHPLETIHRDAFPRPEIRVAALAGQHQAGVVVVGLPLRMDGSEGPAAAKARAFADRLRPLLPAGTRLVFVDERLTTREASERLRQAGHHPRQQKSRIDQAAATLILQDWLDQQQDPASLLLPPADVD